MNTRIIIAALAVITVSACERSADADPAPTVAATASPAAAERPAAAPATAPTLAKGAAPTKEFMVGTWAEKGECKSLPLEFKADGTMVGPFERWDLSDGVLTMLGNPSTVKLAVVDQLTMESRLNGAGEPRTLTRCK